MGLSLQLLFSLDSLADSFIEALRTSSVLHHENIRTDQIRCWLTSSQWLDSESPDTGASLTKLSDIVLSKLNNRQIDEVDICLLLYARDSQTTETFLPLYRYFERFLRVVTTRRLAVIYPRQAAELSRFRENFTKLWKQASTTACDLREIHLMVVPEKNTGKSIQWPLTQVESYYMVNLMKQCRSKLDELLSTCASPCCNTSYARCVFDQNAWRNYYILRSKLDLTKSCLINRDSKLNLQAKEFAETNSLVEGNYQVQFPSLSMGRVNVKDSLEMDRAENPTQHLFQEFRLRENEAFERIKESEFPRFDALEQACQADLALVLDEDKKSLDGFRRALYLHHTILDMANNPRTHQSLMAGHIVEKEIIPVINHIIKGVNTLLGHQRLGGLADEVAETTIDLKVKQIQDAMEQAKWSGAKLGIQNAFSKALQIIRMMQHISMPNEIIDDETEKAVEKSLIAIDDELNKLREELDEKKQSLVQLKTEFAGFRRLRKIFLYKKRKRKILDEIETINERYRQWGSSSNIYMQEIGHFLAFYGRLRLIAALLAEERGRLKQAAHTLTKFGDILTNEHKRLQNELSRIPQGPVKNDVELSYLSKSDMERLYQKFGPAEIDDYIKALLLNSEEVGKTWGQWALLHIDGYLNQSDTYCRARFDAVGSLDLPMLMFDYFPDLAVGRLKNLIQSTANILLPLCERNLTERRYQMMFGFPSDVTTQLQSLERNIVYENRRISLEKAHVVYVDNNDRMCLDLNFSLCNFPPEDYLYWDLFENPPEHT